MSNFTTQVRYLCESFGGTARGVREIDNQIHKANKTIFDFDYPIFNETYRTVLQDKIIRHYYMREIGCETFGLWQMMLCDKMNEIMPYYNQLYNSQLLEIEPLINNMSTSQTSETNRADHNFTGNTEVSGNEADMTNVRESHSSSEEDIGHSENTQTNAGTVKNDSMVTRNNTRTPNLSVVNNGTSSSATHNEGDTVNEQLVDSRNTSANTDWNIQSDTPQGGLDNITGGNTAVIDSNIGVPQGNKLYASQITESTSKSVNTGNSGKTKSTNTNNGTNNVINSNTSSTTGTETTISTDETHGVNTTDMTAENTGSTSSERTGRGQSQSATSVSRNKSDTTTVSNTDMQTGSRQSDTVNKGLTGISQSELLKQWRETFINIDKMVIEELQCLFMGLYE